MATVLLKYKASIFLDKLVVTLTGISIVLINQYASSTCTFCLASKNVQRLRYRAHTHKLQIHLCDNNLTIFIPGLIVRIFYLLQSTPNPFIPRYSLTSQHWCTEYFLDVVI